MRVTSMKSEDGKGTWSLIEIEEIKEAIAYGPCRDNDRFRQKIKCHPSNKRHEREGANAKADWATGNQAHDKESATELMRKLAITGWKEGAQEITKWVAALAKRVPAPRSIAPEFHTNRLIGTGLNVSQYIQKKPDCFSRWVVNPAQRQRKVRIIIDTSVRCSEDQKSMFCRAKAGLGMAYVLENAGYSCTIDLVFPSKVNNNAYIVTMRVKADDQPLNMARAAAALGNIAIMRGGMFYSAITVPWDVGYGFGYDMTKFDRDSLIHLGLVGEADRVVFLKKQRTEEEAEEAVKEIIKLIEKDNNAY